jgi:uncharacterized membrane protein YkgB
MTLMNFYLKLLIIFDFEELTLAVLKLIAAFLIPTFTLSFLIF